MYMAEEILHANMDLTKGAKTVVVTRFSFLLRIKITLESEEEKRLR